MTEEILGRLFIDGELSPGKLEIGDGQIVSIELDKSLWSHGPMPIVAPGMIDLHVHGFAGCEPLGDLEGMAGALARTGTTAFLPTLFPAAPERLGGQCQEFEVARDALPQGVATPIGLHLEGPFVNPLAAGALPVSDLAEPSVQALTAILGPATGSGRGVANVTLAPELPGSLACLEELKRLGIRASLGHSRADPAAARRGVDAGAAGVTHLFNAMSGVAHRSMGLAGFALTEDTLYAEIIGDLVHVEREAFELALRARGPEGLCLVSDALSGAGTGCEVFHLYGRDHVVDDGTAYYPPTQERPERQLAGSVMSQQEMVRRLVSRGVVSLPEALTMATSTPARAMGIEKEYGHLRPGARADLVMIDDTDLSVKRVWVGGRELDLGLPESWTLTE